MLNNKKEQCIQEYEALRSEIISFLEQQRTVWIYMYVLFCTLFVLGLQLSHYLFLVTYIILTSSRKSPTLMLQRHKWGWGLACFSGSISSH